MLGELEKKIVALLKLVKTLQDENAQLQKKNDALTNNWKSAENSVLENNENIKVLNQEKMVTKNAVDDLIKSIDALVVKEKQ